MLINIQYDLVSGVRRPRINTDLWGIVCVINDLYERKPRHFGSPEIRQQLEEKIAHYLAQYPDNINTEAFYLFFVDLLAQHGLSPFKETLLAMVGGWRDKAIVGDEPYQTIAAALPLLAQFKQFHDISVHTTGELLETHNALALTGGRKMHYIITGNVLNAPDNFYPADTILACANILKRGGRAIHMLSYGENEHSDMIGNSRLQKFAGQRHVLNFPPGPYNSRGRMFEGGTEYMILAQQREVSHSDASVRFFRQLPNTSGNRTFTTQDGKINFTEKTFLDHFFHHPEELGSLNLPRISPLHHLTPSLILKSRDAKRILRELEGCKLKEIDGICLIKDQPLMPEEVQRIAASYATWQDETIIQIAELIKPKRIINDQRFYSTGPVAAVPAREYRGSK